jgi:UDP-N-acetyl-D-mannosaminuronate dehydrogenase
MKTVLVIGLGEVGMSMFEIIQESNQYKVFGLDPLIPMDLPPAEVDIIHICFGCKNAESFINDVLGYVRFYCPRLLIINSTIPPKTTNRIAEQCDCLVAHSPTFGTHKNKEFFKSEVRRFAKIVGGVTADAKDATVEHFNNIGLTVRTMKGPLESEILKIMETTYYGAIITFAQEFHRIAHSMGADYADITKVVCHLHELSFARPPAFPDVIGGHCVMPNIELLLSIYDSDYLRTIKESNTKRTKEIKNPEIAKEVAEIQVIVSQFWKKLRERFEL